MDFINFLLIFSIGFLNTFVNNQNVDPWEIRCHVCKAVIHEMEEAVGQVDPKKVIDISGFRLDSDGNSITKTIPYSKSETFLTELMENICDKMDDYAKTVHKKTGKSAVIKFMINGQMNSQISEYDFVQDGDLNKSLKHYCLEILEDHEDTFVQSFQTDNLVNDLDIQICSVKANYCNDEPLPEEYKLEKDEF